MVFQRQSADLCDFGFALRLYSDITGYSFHADFTDGWDTAVLQDAIDTCPDDTSGNIERCPALAKSIDRAKQQACLPENEIVDEDVGLGTWLRQLPGTNQVSSRSVHTRIGKTAVDDDADCCADGSARITA